MNKNKTSYSYILFDLDGTLIDSSECAIVATQKAFSELNLNIPLSKQIIHFMGTPIEISFKEMGANHLNEKDFNHLLSIFRNYYQTESYHHIKPFPEMENCLLHLKNNGKKIAIVTSKKTDVALSNLKQLGIEHYIDFIIGSDKVNQPKPHPESIITTLNHFNVVPNQFDTVIMIGDTTFDIDMGKTLQIDTCAVTWGAHSVNDLSISKPKYIVNNFTELLNIL